MLQNIGMTLARRWDAQGLTRVTVNTPPAKTGGVFTYFPTLLFYEMARPERLPGAAPLAPSGPPAKPAFCAASRLVELPAARFVARLHYFTCFINQSLAVLAHPIP
jgi:hypothetical protein